MWFPCDWVWRSWFIGQKGTNVTFFWFIVFKCGSALVKTELTSHLVTDRSSTPLDQWTGEFGFLLSVRRRRLKEDKPAQLSHGKLLDVFEQVHGCVIIAAASAAAVSSHYHRGGMPALPGRSGTRTRGGAVTQHTSPQAPGTTGPQKQRLMCSSYLEISSSFLLQLQSNAFSYYFPWSSSSLSFVFIQRSPYLRKDNRNTSLEGALRRSAFPLGWTRVLGCFSDHPVTSGPSTLRGVCTSSLIITDGNDQPFHSTRRLI